MFTLVDDNCIITDTVIIGLLGIQVSNRVYSSLFAFCKNVLAAVYYSWRSIAPW